MILCICSSIGDVVHIMVRYLHFPNRLHPDQHERLLTIIVDAFYFCSNLILYTFIILRIYQPFEIHKCIHLYLFILMIVSIAFSGLYCYKIWLLDDTWEWLDHVKYIITPMSLNDFLLNISLLIIFANKMKATVRY